jgi:hypothetical protein
MVPLVGWKVKTVARGSVGAAKEEEEAVHPGSLVLFSLNRCPTL